MNRMKEQKAAGVSASCGLRSPRSGLGLRGMGTLDFKSGILEANRKGEGRLRQKGRKPLASSRSKLRSPPDAGS